MRPMWVFTAMAAVGLAASAGLFYVLWKWDVCCPMPDGQPEGSIHICGHRRAFKLTGPRWWACPEWLRIRKISAMRAMVEQVEAEADLILVGSGNHGC